MPSEAIGEGDAATVGIAVTVGITDGAAVALLSGATVMVSVGVYEACGIESWLPEALENDKHPLAIVTSARILNIANAFVFIVRLTSLSLSPATYKMLLYLSAQDNVLIWYWPYNKSMYSRSLSYIPIGVMIIGILLMSGCTQSAVPSQDAISRANVTADRVLQSINDGNYANFSMNFSQVMLQGVNQSRFDGLRNDILTTNGKYISRSNVQNFVVGGDNVFIYDCQFEKGRLQFQFSINSTDMSTVTGLYYK